MTRNELTKERNDLCQQRKALHEERKAKNIREWEILSKMRGVDPRKYQVEYKAYCERKNARQAAIDAMDAKIAEAAEAITHAPYEGIGPSDSGEWNNKPINGMSLPHLYNAAMKAAELVSKDKERGEWWAKKHTELLEEIVVRVSLMSVAIQ